MNFHLGLIQYNFHFSSFLFSSVESHLSVYVDETSVPFFECDMQNDSGSGKKHISMTKVCDGEDSCGDGSDERKSLCDQDYKSE